MTQKVQVLYCEHGKMIDEICLACLFRPFEKGAELESKVVAEFSKRAAYTVDELLRKKAGE